MTETRTASRVTAEAQAAIKSEFDRQLAAGLHPAAALAVYVDGRLAVDLVAGEARPEPRQAAGGDALFRIFSCGKPLAAACLWALKEHGKFGWDDPVAKHWPEFARHGKGKVTVKHVLTHGAGLPTTPVELSDLRNVADWGRCVSAMENAELEFEPGSRVQYHPGTFGWLVGELVTRISGRPFNEFFKDYVAAPLGLRDTHFALARSLNDRVAKLKAMPGFDQPPVADAFNNERSYAAVFPGGGCISTARDLARFYAALAGGGRIGGVPWLRTETVSDVTALHAEGVDNSVGRYQRRTLGMALGSEPPNTYASEWASRTFGHGGLGTSVSWGDPETGVAMAYITTGLQADAANRERLHAMSAAVRRALVA
jgi:CubicO group peptidase (beta-lactamase class C family)